MSKSGDIYTAGFPCQDTSRANPRGKGLQGERSGLFYPFMDIVCRNKPRYVILENSPMLIYRKELLHILREFTKCGYNAEWQVISKRAFAYPDERERLILIAYSKEIGRSDYSQIFCKTYYQIIRQQITERLELEKSRPKHLDSEKIWQKFITGTLQADTGLPQELVKNEIAGYGDAICPDVAQLAFELIKIFDKNNT